MFIRQMFKYVLMITYNIIERKSPSFKMRLTIAISILTQTLTTISSSAVAATVSTDVLPPVPANNHNEEITINEDEENSQHNKSNNHIVKRLDSHSYSSVFNTLKPSTSIKDDTMRIECKPSSSSDPYDFGLLYCGVDRHCKESPYSSLGGYCMDSIIKENETTTTTNHNIMSRRRRRRRRREQVVGQRTFFEIAELFCNESSSSELVSCDCSQLDFDESKGELTCYLGPYCGYYESGCTTNENTIGGENEADYDSFSVCLSETFTGKAEDKLSYSYTSCYNQTMPATGYGFKYCTDFTFDVIYGPTCDIQVDGISCNSCEVSIGGGVEYGENCEVFDCSNTKINYQADRCTLFSDPVLRQVSFSNYLYESKWPCPNGGCNICNKDDGNARMTNAINGNFTYSSPFFEDKNVTLNCYGAMYDGMRGAFSDSSYCEAFQSVVQEPCGCESSSDIMNNNDSPPKPPLPVSASPTTSNTKTPMVDPAGSEAPVPVVGAGTETATNKLLPSFIGLLIAFYVIGDIIF
jgi:hypothetical protein